ncbi:MAG: thioredoxin [Kordia sp.]|nr:MAG: thioredoxin [Kordia sp.]
MKKVVFALATLAIVSCKKEDVKPVDYALFSGKITNNNTDSVFVKGKDFSKAIVVKEDGTFSDTLKISNGKFIVKIGPETSGFHLKQGDNLNLTINTKEFDETISYTGEGAVVNNYLAKAYMLEEVTNAKMNPRELFASAPEVFTSKVKAVLTSADSLLTSFDIKDVDFVASAKKNNNFTYLAALKNYPNYYKMVTGGKEVVLPEGFSKELEGLDLDNALDFDSSDAYKGLVMGDIQGKATEATEKDSTLSFAMSFINQIKGLKSDNIKQALLPNVAREIKAGNDESDAIYKEIIAIATDKKFKESLTKQLADSKKLAKGNPSPIFENYENHAGGTTSLADLKGKFVYIDMWATWCGPCKREIPFLKEVEKEFHGKNIEFVSISVDRKNAHETWVNMIKEKEMTGVQLFADNNFKSKFAVEYGVNSIPRFILLDPNGNIVSADAPRPSSPELKTLLTEQGI